MKKLLLLAVVACAIMSFGIYSGLAHAETTTATPAELQQELQVMKATLANLQMKAGVVPQSDAGTSGGSTAVPVTVTVTAPVASTGANLSASDRAALSSALGSLVAALSSLNATVAANPQAVSSHGATIAAVLGGMERALVAINSDVRNGSMSGSGTAMSGSVATTQPTTGIAQTQPATPSVMPTPVASAQPAAQPSTGSLVPTAAPAGSNNQTQTAQAMNSGNFVVNHWPTITIIVLVALILLILFWPSKGSDNESHGSPRPMAKPQAPNRPVMNSASQNPRAETPPAASPVATVVSSPAAKVTVIRPQQNQQKTA